MDSSPEMIARARTVPGLVAELGGVCARGNRLKRSHDAAIYLSALQRLGLEVDAWETTYLHVLHGPDPVFEWVSGTGARPTLQALPAPLREQFATAFRRRLREAYPETGHGVVLPFRRIFVVGRRPD